MSIDLNCDMGESFGAYEMGRDAEVMPYITSANIACGWHAGDPLVMDRTVALAKRHGVGVGAHPGYPDLMGFGRRPMELAPEELRNYLIYQIGSLLGFCRAHGVRLAHVKPHGSLYNTAVVNPRVARAVAEAVVAVDPDLVYVALAGPKGRLVRLVAEELGMRVKCEAFPDRAYTPEGNLAPRSQPGAVIHDPELVAERALRMASTGEVIAVDGHVVRLDPDTLCVHGDNPEAVELVRRIRRTIEDHGLNLKPMTQDA